jgi:hypothetical protein
MKGLRQLKAFSAPVTSNYCTWTVAHKTENSPCGETNLNFLLAACIVRHPRLLEMSIAEIYQPLNSEKSEIRLIEITSDTNSTNIECRLSTVSLADNPEFSALSYVWGDPSTTKPILVNGSSLHVTVNLAAALRWVKYHWKHKFPGRDPNSFRLWADGICINQSDITEREAQVQLMGIVYSQAELVISWLGYSIENIGLAFETLKIISRETRGTPNERIYVLNWMINYQYLCVENEDTGNPSWNAIRALHSLKYWSRVWIFQEVVLGKNVILTYGSKQLDFVDLQIALTWLRRFENLFRSTGLVKPRFFHSGLWRRFSGGSFTMVNFLRIVEAKDIIQLSTSNNAEKRAMICRNARLLEASDPRDQIYGLVGLTNVKIIPDYKKSIVEVYCDYIGAMLQCVKNIDWLSEAGIGLFENNCKDSRPSWIPHFWEISKIIGYTIVGFEGTKHAEMFKDSDPCPSLVDRKLVVTGFLGPAVTKAHGCFNDPMQMKNEFPELVCDFISRYPVYVTGEHPLKAIYQVLLNNDAWGTSTGVLIIRVYAFIYFILGIPSRSTAKHKELLSHLGLLSESDFESVYSLINAFLPESVDNLDVLLPASEDEVRLEYRRFLGCFFGIQRFYRFFETDGGYLGLAPKGTLPGDVISIVKGSHARMVLRKVEDHYLVIGSCWVYGLMKHDEATQLLETGQASIQRLEIW